MTSDIPSTAIQQEAYALVKKNNLEEAAELLEGHCAINADDTKTLLMLADVLADLGRNNEAISHYREVIRQHPERTEAHKRLGITLLACKQTDEAVIFLRTATKLCPGDAETQFALGEAQYQLRLFEAAQASYKTAVLLKPENARYHFALGETLYRLGQLEAAQANLETAIRLDSKLTEACYWLANTLYDLGDLEGAESAYRETIRRQTDHTRALINLGGLLAHQGRFSKATVCYENALAHNPGNAEAHYNLGVARYRMGQLDKAEASFRQALTIRPDNAGAYNGLGLIHRDRLRLEASIRFFQEALRIDPYFYSAGINLGRCLTSLGRHEEALVAFRRILNHNPNDVEATFNLGVVYQTLGKLAEATIAYQQTLRINPMHAQSHNNIGIIRNIEGRYDEAIASYNKAIELNPRCADFYTNLGVTLHLEGNHTEAEGCYKKALQFNPNAIEAHGNLGLTLIASGRIDEGIATLRNVLRFNPDAAKIHSNLLFSLNYLADQEPQSLFDEHRRWGEIHCRRDMLATPTNPIDPDRRLRVGYVTPDLRGHSVSYFIEPVLENHDKSCYETYCYVEIPQNKAFSTSERLHKLCDHWTNTSGLSDRALAERIRADRIDILIDLAGHTDHNRLLAFSYRPAPVQVSWIGYCNTTGLPTIDYRLTDAWADPPGQEQFHTEDLIRLPHGFLCYKPRDDAPPVTPPPAKLARNVTFGSFNILEKTRPEVVELWSRILHAIPNARLILKNRSWASCASDSPTIRRFYETFEHYDISRERLELIDFIPSPQKHLQLFSQLDIALDTFPYNGTTTTCETLWMGVPVISLAGNRHAGRVGVSILSRIGLQELVAQTPDDYVRLAVELAGDVDRIARIRSGLRNRMKHSTLCDAVEFTRELEATLRLLWKKWCINQGTMDGNGNISTKYNIGKMFTDAHK